MSIQPATCPAVGTILPGFLSPLAVTLLPHFVLEVLSLNPLAVTLLPHFVLKNPLAHTLLPHFVLEVHSSPLKWPADPGFWACAGRGTEFLPRNCAIQHALTLVTLRLWASSGGLQDQARSLLQGKNFSQQAALLKPSY
jgi:hypothetical protein